MFDTIFDVDYANGLGDRPDVSIHIYDATGRLILTARDGNIAEDRPATPGSADIDDLSRGTVGATDPFLGVIELATGTYRVAITSDTQMPSDLDQFVQAIATNPDVRLEPIETVRRIAEDHIETGNTSTADPPQVSLLFDDQAEVAYHLGDVTLYLYRVPSPLAPTEVLTVDPFTGAQETEVGSLGAVTLVGGDIAMHPNGWLYTYRQALVDAQSGEFLDVDPGDATATLLRDDGIQTYFGVAQPQNGLVVSQPSNDGVQFNGVTFYESAAGALLDTIGLAVGERGLADSPNALPVRRGRQQHPLPVRRPAIEPDLRPGP